MAAREDWCSNQISKLLEEDLRVPTLNEIKDHFSSISPDEARVTANNLQLASIFDCLNDSNVEQVDLACEVLTLCMSNLTIGSSIGLYSTPLERAFNHPYASVKIMALKEIQRNIETTSELIKFCRQSKLMKSVIKCIADQELSVASIAKNIIFKVGVISEGMQVLVSPDMLNTIHEVMTTNEIIRLRMNELVIEISKNSLSSMNVLESSGLLLPLLQDLDNNDVLLKMNIIELLGQLVVTEHGYQYLESKGTISKILNTYDSSDVASVQICEPGILRFFGHLAHWKPSEAITKHAKIVNRIYTAIQEVDSGVIGVCLDTLGYIGETNDGKFSLETTGDQLTVTLKSINNQIQTYPTEIKLRALSCLESLFRITDFDSKTTNLIRKWYYSMDDNPMHWIYNFAKNPFHEIRLVTFNVLRSISQHNWGQEIFRNTPGFVEFLLDRRIENFKECKEEKYEIVKNLAFSSVFDHNTQKRFQDYVREGPFYVQAITEVAIEGD
ncbi:hypothetical protein RN001_006800 [Aquatica leii]|uniref:26S proteasome non-ATPase regulatory subunit 5 n=1 Tax=Aquatica leii TaxID=1421715 RepID=A0AAN7PJ26_9COLE|nr:hypothetical protein RN001_006800 [Aquatica leii]